MKNEERKDEEKDDGNHGKPHPDNGDAKRRTAYVY